jgi:hypothetical protein
MLYGVPVSTGCSERDGHFHLGHLPPDLPRRHLSGDIGVLGLGQRGAHAALDGLLSPQYGQEAVPELDAGLVDPPRERAAPPPRRKSQSPALAAVSSSQVRRRSGAKTRAPIAIDM